MKPDHYNIVRLALDGALRVFRDAEAELSREDREFLRELELLRSCALKAESGHPFPFARTRAPMHVAAPEVDRTSTAAVISGGEAPKKAKQITLVIADDEDTVRELVRAVLTADGEFEVVAEACDGREAIAQVAAHRPDLILMDLNMPGLDGIAATREVLLMDPTSKVLVFSANRDPVMVQRALKAGAIGYLFKPSHSKALVRALRAIHRGETVIPEEVSGDVYRA